jgi:amylosucrase
MSRVLLDSPKAFDYLDLVWGSAASVLEFTNPRDQDIFQARLVRCFQNLFEGLWPLYGSRDDFESFLERLVIRMAETYLARSEELKRLDIQRDLRPDWFLQESMVGYVFYTERFAGSLKGIEKHLDYLEELGVTYIHPMKTIRPREGENDGGFAVLDYKDVDPVLGSIDDLEHLCTLLRHKGISICIDLVLNHCAKDHEWALKAKAGEKKYQDYFYMFDDRTMPDEYEKTLPEIFPDFKPGNFVYYDALKKWVWCTFNEYQWDLNWTNPEVFLEIVDILFYLSNKGVDVFRLDAVAFMWKRLGTNSQNQPEVFSILQALRACSNITTPAVIHKAEAIVSPSDLIKYFGLKEHYGKVSHLAYHNVFMVQYWSSLASRDTRLMTHVMKNFPLKPGNTSWGTYIRCHDDIGWAVTDEDAAAVGLDGFLHRQFLSDYYSGEFEGSHARGEVFQFNPVTQDRRISGSAASLAGLEVALESADTKLLNLSLERILLGYALMCGFGGLPLLYMGDELGMLNDKGYLERPDLASDNRWMHRPPMDWDKVGKRNQPGTLEHYLFNGVRHILKVRKQTPHLHAGIASEIIDTGHPHIFAYVRRHPLGNFLGLYNFTEHVQHVVAEVLYSLGLHRSYDKLESRFVDVIDGHISLKPCGRLWLVSEDD